jgi:hypothetical protein
MRIHRTPARLVIGIGTVWALTGTVPVGSAMAPQTAPPASTNQTATDQYARYELDPPDTATFHVSYEVSATTAGATRYVDPTRPGTMVSQATATDLMTGQPLSVSRTATALVVTLLRPVPPKGQGRIRIDKTVRTGQGATGYTVTQGLGVFTEPLNTRRGIIVLPAGFELVACNMPSQVLSEPDGRVSVAFMNQAPGEATIVVKTRKGAQTGSSASRTPLTTARSWEPPAAQGPTERSRLAERAHQDRDITYFLQDPSTNAFSLFHDYTESRPGIDKYINVVRTGSHVSNPSAYILDTGEELRHEVLRGDGITAAKIDAGGPVTPDTEVVVVYFSPVKAGQSVRLRISETYAAPQSYRLEGQDLVFDRSLGRPRNSVVLPSGWYLTELSIPAVISETSDGLIRLDFYNGRNDSLDVLIKGRRRVQGSGPARREPGLTP